MNGYSKLARPGDTIKATAQTQEELRIGRVL